MFIKKALLKKLPCIAKYLAAYYLCPIKTNTETFGTNEPHEILKSTMKVQGLLDNTTQQMRKGILELCILSIISDEGEAYPTDIIKRLEKSELMVVEGTMYPLLARLKSAGLLDYTWRESASGPPRKYYALTDDGKEFLGGLMTTWHQLVNAVSQSTQNQSTN